MGIENTPLNPILKEIFGAFTYYSKKPRIPYTQLAKLLRFMQTRKWSLIETCVQTSAAMVTSFLGQLYIFPQLGWNPTLQQNTLILIFFTIISLIRSYGIRRIFNRLHKYFNNTEI